MDTDGTTRTMSRTIGCYVAMGDSLTAGTASEPGVAWPDQIASALREANPSLTFRNLAADGATSVEVADQLDVALPLGPDLVTVMCGVNDVMASVRLDTNGYATRLAGIFDRLRAGVPAAAILTATVPEDLTLMRLRPRTRDHASRGLREFNAATLGLARERGIPCLDAAKHPGLGDPANLGGDGFHPSAAGHALMAREVAGALRRHFDIEIAG